MSKPLPTGLQQIADRVKQACPGTKIKYDEPRLDEGIWFLDIEYKSHQMVVEWSSREERQFGLSDITTAHALPFSKCDAVFADLDVLCDHIIHYISHPKILRLVGL